MNLLCLGPTLPKPSGRPESEESDSAAETRRLSPNGSDNSFEPGPTLKKTWEVERNIMKWIQVLVGALHMAASGISAPKNAIQLSWRACFCCSQTGISSYRSKASSLL